MIDRYSDWLLVSDVDGTLNNKKRQLPDVNKVAITDFIKNGGNFTLCSGRNLQSLEKHYKKLNLKTPAICMNGACIFDFDKNTVLYYIPISSEGERILLDIYQKYKTLQITVFDMNTVYPFKKSCIYGYVVSFLDKLNRKLCRNENELPKGNWGKVTFFGLPGVCKKVLTELQSDKYKGVFECMYTSPITVEVMAAGVNKGTAVSELCNILNIDSNKVGAIGDYFNDEAMLKSVSHPVCCGQAPEELKKVSEYVTCHCNDGAVSDFINYIVKTYIS